MYPLSALFVFTVVITVRHTMHVLGECYLLSLGYKLHRAWTLTILFTAVSLGPIPVRDT